MTPAQKRLRELRERQSKERGRMAELALVDELTDEQRSELDTIEKGTPDLERQIRAATVALEEEEAAAETRETESPDAEMRERIELRGKALLTNYLLAAARGRMVDGAEAELAAAAGVQGIPLELWDVPAEQRQDRETRDITPAPGTVGVNLDPIRPAVFANSIAPRLGIAMPRVGSGTYATGTITTSQSADAKEKSAAIAATAGAITVTTATPKTGIGAARAHPRGYRRGRTGELRVDPPGEPVPRIVRRAGRSSHQRRRPPRRTSKGFSIPSRTHPRRPPASPLSTPSSGPSQTESMACGRTPSRTWRSSPASIPTS